MRVAALEIDVNMVDALSDSGGLGPIDLIEIIAVGIFLHHGVAPFAHLHRVDRIDAA